VREKRKEIGGGDRSKQAATRECKNREYKEERIFTACSFHSNLTEYSVLGQSAASVRQRSAFRRQPLSPSSGNKNRHFTSLWTRRWFSIRVYNEEKRKKIGRE